MSGFLDKLKESLQSLVSGNKDDSVVGIDIGSSAIKLVQLKRVAGKVVLQTYGAVALGPYLEGEIGQIPRINTNMVAQAIVDLFKEANVTASKVVLSVQSAASLVFVLSLPPVPDRQLSQVVTTEATKYIPMALSEVSFDWWRIPSDNSKQTSQSSSIEVLVAAIRKETIRFYRQILEKTKLQPLSFEIEIFSSLRSVFSQEIKPVALIDFGASSTRVAIIEYGVIRKFQTINRGSEYYSDAISKSLQIPFKRAERLKKEVGLVSVNGDTEKTRVAEMLKTDTQYVLYEIQKTLVNYEKERSKVVSKILVTGGGARMPGFFEEMQEVVSIPSQMATPFNRVEYPSFLDATLEEVGPEFAIALGAALKHI